MIAEQVKPPDGWTPGAHVAFSSARKWSGTTFESHGTWLLGAPEVLFDAAGEADESASREQGVGARRRGPSRARSSPAPTRRSRATTLPDGVQVVGLVVLVEQLRPDAGDIMKYFAEQHVQVKIISGDSSETVSAVAQRLGIEGADRHVDLRHVEGDSYDGFIEDTVVFGRVRPEQKRDLVEALQRAGHTAAMTGDGVNDIPALKRADIGIAMNTATPATKSVAQLVLVDGRFDRLPSVVAEGRRVVANMERVSTLFITKTVYSVMFVLAIGFSGSVFPFLPRHISLISELTIGVPAFLLSFRSADQPARPGYLRRVLWFAIPAGLLASAIVLATYWLARSPLVDASLAEARSVATISLAATALWILYRIMRPLDRYDVCLLVGLVVMLGVIAASGPGRRFYELHWPSAGDLVVLCSITGSQHPRVRSSARDPPKVRHPPARTGSGCRGVWLPVGVPDSARTAISRAAPRRWCRRAARRDVGLRREQHTAGGQRDRLGAEVDDAHARPSRAGRRARACPRCRSTRAASSPVKCSRRRWIASRYISSVEPATPVCASADNSP